MSNSRISEGLVHYVGKFLNDGCVEQINKWKEKQADVIRNNWKVHFLLEAFLASTRSMDSQTQCGCVLVKNNRVIGTGYNSFIGNIQDNILPNVRQNADENEFDGKYPFMIHAEHNAILNCANEGISTKGAKAYVTGQPCYNCFQFLYQAGIREIYFGNNKAVMSQNDRVQNIFKILYSLMQGMEIYEIQITDNIQEKIDKIKSCRS
jgi:dCMP deaminase